MRVLSNADLEKFQKETTVEHSGWTAEMQFTRYNG